MAAKAQELERAAQKTKDEALERERLEATTASNAPDDAPDGAEASAADVEPMDQGNNDEDPTDKQLNTGDVVREELERLGVDQKLLEVLDKAE